jgi:hypothetical protein
MVLSLSGFLSTEILQNLLKKVDCIRNHLRCAPDRISRGDIFVGGTYEDDLSMGMFFGIMPHRTEMFADFFRAWGALQYLV